MLRQGANLCDVGSLSIALAIGDSLTTGAQRIDICRGGASHLSLDSQPRNPHYPAGTSSSYINCSARNDETPLSLMKRFVGTFIGLDAHKLTITAAILRPGSRKPELTTFDNTERTLARFVRAQQRAMRPGRSASDSSACSSS
jgi:hypothetical protein